MNCRQRSRQNIGISQISSKLKMRWVIYHMEFPSFESHDTSPTVIPNSE